jgi:hypothetical protein
MIEGQMGNEIRERATLEAMTGEFSARKGDLGCPT